MNTEYENLAPVVTIASSPSFGTSPITTPRPTFMYSHRHTGFPAMGDRAELTHLTVTP